ncbi:MAG: GNAT family N-acetyltransferase [Rhodanobacteraceae bacterium]
MPPSTPLHYRNATLDDVPAIVALVESAYRGDASRVGWTTEADLLDGQRIDPEGVRESIETADSVVLLAERAGSGEAGALQACAHIARLDDNAYFGMFAVRPEQQGSGLGGAVLEEAERRAAQQWHCRFMCMTVIDLREELIAWYQRRGYVRTGQYKPFPYGDERFGIPRRDDLRFEWLRKPLSGGNAA